MEEMKNECSRLRSENAKLIQHQNMKQKLQYHVKIKEENNDLKREVRELREELNRIVSFDDNIYVVLSLIPIYF